MFHFQIKLLRMIYRFTTTQREKKKNYKKESREAKMKRKRKNKIKNFSSHFSSPFTSRRSIILLHIVNFLIYCLR